MTRERLAAVARAACAFLCAAALASCAEAPRQPQRYTGPAHALAVAGRDAAGHRTAAIYEPGALVPARHVSLRAVVEDGMPLDVALGTHPRAYVRIRNPEGYVQRGSDLLAPSVIERVEPGGARKALYAYTRRAGTASGDLPYFVADGWIVAIDGGWYRYFDVHGNVPQGRVRISTPAGRALQIYPGTDGTAYVVRRSGDIPRPERPVFSSLLRESSDGVALERRSLQFGSVTRVVPLPRGRVLLGFMGSTEGCSARAEEHAGLHGAALRTIVGDLMRWSAVAPDGRLVAVGANCGWYEAYAKTVSADGRTARSFDLGVRDPGFAALSADGYLALSHGPRFSSSSGAEPAGVEIYRINDGAHVASLRDLPDQPSEVYWR